MKTTEYHGVFSELMDRLLIHGRLIYVQDIVQWCRERGISEQDPEKPLRLVLMDNALSVLVKEDISPASIEARIKEVWVRDQVTNVAHQDADLLDTDEKKLAFLFLSEYASALPENQNDLVVADQWAFGRMRQLGYLE